MSMPKINWDKEKFMELVYPEPNTGCWLWAGYHCPRGYGHRNFNDITTVAHRFSYYLFNGPFDLSMHVLHKCDFSACVNPDHLYLGDQRQNNIDRDTRGRQRAPKGTQQPSAKLTDDKVRQIRAMYIPKSSDIHCHPELSQLKIAKMFGVSEKLIFNIVNRRAWKHVE